jgi:hypothetical protein
MAENMELPKVHLTFSPTIGALAAALVKAQTTLPNAPKNHTAEVTMKTGGKYTYSYADLAGVWDAGRGPLTGAGLAVVQAPTLTAAGLTMTTVLMHSSGEWARGDMEGFPVPDRTPQGVGTSITYARRYTLGAMIGAVSEEDDDGGNGGKPKPKREAKPETAPGAGRTDAGPVFPFGKVKGQPIAGAKAEDLEWFAKAMREAVAAPEKVKYKDQNAALLAAIEAELARQRSGTVTKAIVNGPPDPAGPPPPKSDPMTHFREAVKIGTANGWQEANVFHWLKTKRGKPAASQVTPEDVEALRAALEPPPPEDDAPF